MNTTESIDAVKSIEATLHEVYSPHVVKTILKIVETMETTVRETGTVSLQDCFKRFDDIDTKELVAIATEMAEVDEETGLTKKELFAKMLTKLIASEIRKQDEVVLNARVALAEEVRKQELVEDRLLTFEAQNKIVASARKACVSAYHKTVAICNREGETSMAAYAAQSTYARARKYLQEQEAVYEKMSVAYARDFFPTGTSL